MLYHDHFQNFKVYQIPKAQLKAYGFEIKKQFHMDATKWIKEEIQIVEDVKRYGFDKTRLEKIQPTLFT